MRLLVVDDSAFMRTALSKLFRDEGFEVHTARDGAEALEFVEAIDPNVVTLDVNMPAMDGLTCLSHIMTRAPRPVVMVSSITTRGAIATLEALAMGAVDFVPKPSGTISLDVKQVGHELVAKVKAAAQSRRRPVALKAPAPPVRARPPRPPAAVRASELSVVVLGASTGGPVALEEVVLRLPEDFPCPVVVAQHMPGGFTRALAERLDGRARVRVTEVSTSVPLRPGEVVIGRGDADVIVSRRGDELRAVSVPSDRRYLWHPSVDRLAHSVGTVVAPERIIGVILTGMGNDGARSLTELHAAGAYTIAEAPETCVVHGMPGALAAQGAADVVLPLHDIASHLDTIARTRSPHVPLSRAG